MTLKLFGTGISLYTRMVATILYEKEIPFTLVKVHIAKREHKSPAYLEKQPFGLIPYIDDDGFILYESRAICRYLATKYRDQGTPLIPLELKANALFEQAASVELNFFHTYAGRAVKEMFYKPLFGKLSNLAVFEEMIANLSATLAVYDTILGRQKYITGNELTLADLFHLPFGAMILEVRRNIMDDKPNVSRWFNELHNRPSWQAAKDGNYDKETIIRLTADNSVNKYLAS